MRRKQLVRWVSIMSSVCLLLGVAGSFALAAEKKLTSQEFVQLSKEDKLKYRTIVIRPRYCTVKESLPDFRERMEMGDLKTFMDAYSLSLFLLEHPECKMEVGITAHEPEKIMAALAAGTGDSWFDIALAGGPIGWKNLGALADITDLVKDWDQNAYLNETAPALWKSLWIDGRCYGVPDNRIETYGVRFRKEWFKEAGVFDKNGKPQPEDNWTYTDLRKIAVKLTDVKKKRWGFGYTPSNYGGLDQWVYIWGYSFGVLEPGFLAPDKSGENTWRFTVTPQAIQTFQYLHDLVWKYKCTLADPASDFPWDPYYKDFVAGRVGMARSSSVQACGSARFPSVFNPDHTWIEDVGWTHFPRGEETGLRPNTLIACLHGFDASLSKEELKLAFQYHDWLNAGKGFTLYLMRVADEVRLMGKTAYPSWQLGSLTYKVREIPPGCPEPSDIIPQELLDTHAKEKVVPAKPQGQEFGLNVSTWSLPVEELPYVQALCQMVITKEDLDIKAELEKIAVQVNEEGLNYKIEGDKEKLRNYYAAVGDFFEENYATFYESEMFKEIWEKYYNIW